MKRGIQGRFMTTSTVGESVQAFMPHPLPPEPPIEWSHELLRKFDEANLALGRLDSVVVLLPDTSLFLYTYIRKEAVLSSMIEGTQSSISDLLLYELDEEPGVPIDDVMEVSCYVAALEYGREQLAESLPVSSRLIRNIHAVLLSKGRGRTKAPGSFRHSQNWIGGTRPGNATFVPPPPHEVLNCMGDLEKYINDQPEHSRSLLKAALSHVQFETIHPFLDGNGRLGRMLISLILLDQKVLSQPLLYLSLYFKTHRRYYYELLNRVRFDGEWEAWLDFFAEAVSVTANLAFETAQRLLALEAKDRAAIQSLGRSAYSTLIVHRALMERPLVSTNWLVKKTGITPATVNRALANLEKLGIVREITAKKRNRLFIYAAYIDIMNQGTELPDS